MYWHTRTDAERMVADGDPAGDKVGKASAAESFLRFSISPVTNISFAPWEKAGQTDYVERCLT